MPTASICGRKSLYRRVSTGNRSKISNLIEQLATDAEKGKGFDLADYLISEQARINQMRINRHNEFVDSYNAKLEQVLADENLTNQFNAMLGEQKAVRIINGGLSETEAENLITDFENVRNIVLSLRNVKNKEKRERI